MHTFVSMGQMCTHLDGLDLEQKKKQVILFVLITSLLNIYEFIIYKGHTVVTFNFNKYRYKPCHSFHSMPWKICCLKIEVGLGRACFHSVYLKSSVAYLIEFLSKSRTIKIHLIYRHTFLALNIRRIKGLFSCIFAWTLCTSNIKPHSNHP